jgi:hypothetical protein
MPSPIVTTARMLFYKVLSTAQQYIPNISGPALLRLELTDLPEDAILMSIWERECPKLEYLYMISEQLLKQKASSEK